MSSPCGRIPDFFLVGHPKCGTTAMYEMLRQHPSVFMCPIKEPRFFNRAQDTDGGSMALADYMALQSGAMPEQIVGEASSGYLMSRSAPFKIAHANPEALIIAILREPASFVWALHLQNLRSGRVHTPDLAAALRLEPDRYAERLRYVAQLERYHQAFPRDNVLVLVYDDYRRDVVGTMRGVFTFLGVDADIDIHPTEANRSGVRSLRFAAGAAYFRDSDNPVVHALRHRIYAAMSPAKLQRIKRLYHRLNRGSPPSPDAELMSELRARFAPGVRDLGQYLGRDLCSLWGYPPS